MEKIVYDGIHLKTEWFIHKFLDPTDEISAFLQAGGKMYQALQRWPHKFIGIEHFVGNLALDEGIQELLDNICGLGTPTKWDNSNARIGVGDSSAAENASQTGLQGTNKTFKAMDATYPQRSGQTSDWRATFGASEGNHSWQEFTIVNGADDSAKNLNRKCVDKGTKSSGETWTASVRMTPS
jgi:hypothetical protein